MSTSTPPVSLRPVDRSDVAIFFDQMQDAEAQRMAAFVSDNPSDRAEHEAHWNRLLASNSIATRTILAELESGAPAIVAGHLAEFEMFGKRQVTYWIGRPYWGRGIATAALQTYLAETTTSPIYAQAANDNLASRRVLEKCGFRVHATERGFANARGEEIEETVFIRE